MQFLGGLRPNFNRDGSWGTKPRKNCGIHIAAFLSRQPLVKGERLVRYEVNAVMPQGGLETSTSIFKGEEVLLTNHLWGLQWALNPGSSKKACVTASARVWYLEPKWLRYQNGAPMCLNPLSIALGPAWRLWQKT